MASKVNHPRASREHGGASGVNGGTWGTLGIRSCSQPYREKLLASLPRWLVFQIAVIQVLAVVSISFDYTVPR
jgi:hypothetical protein